MLTNRDTIEFYDDARLLTAVRSSMVPPRGSLINIRSKTWRVAAITYALDHSGDSSQCGMRANIDLVDPAKTPQ